MLTRRNFCSICAAALALAIGVPQALAQNKIKVAAVYTVPIEQQWVSRIHKALNAAKDRGEIEYSVSENVANADYERVMREYAEKGNTFIVGESFASSPRRARSPRTIPKVSFLMGSSGKPQAPNFAVFDNYIQEPAYLTGMIAGGMTKTEQDRHGRRLSDPRSEPADARVHGGRQGNQSQGRVHVSFIGSWFDPPKAKEAAFAMIEKGADVMYAERFGVSDAAKENGKLAIGNVINTQDKYPDTVVASALWNMEPTIDRALKQRQGRQVQGRGLRPVLDDEVQGLRAGAARHVRRQGADRPAGQGQGQGEGDPRRQVQGAGRRDGAEVDREVTLTMRRRGADNSEAVSVSRRLL